VHDTDELKQRLQQMWRNVDQNIIDNAIDKWRKRLRACVQANGGHFEHVCCRKQYACVHSTV